MSEEKYPDVIELKLNFAFRMLIKTIHYERKN